MIEHFEAYVCCKQNALENITKYNTKHYGNAVV